MTARSGNVSPPTDHQIVISRAFDAPRDLVFDAWVDPKQVVKWWGQDGSTTTTVASDIRAGGSWRFIMRNPDGIDYRIRLIYTEVVRPERIGFDHRGDDNHDAPGFHVDVTFIALAPGRTELTMRSTFASAVVRDRVWEDGAKEGGKQMLDRLAAHLRSLQ